jgi:hypothetical protein
MAPFPLLIESALRALLVALVVWAGLRLLRVGNVLAQKTVWALVLAAAVAMPVLMRWRGLPAFAILRVPLPGLRPAPQIAPPAESALLAPHIGEISTSSPFMVDAVSEPSSTGGSRFPAPSISKKQYGIPSSAPLPSIQQEPGSPLASVENRPLVRLLHWQSVAEFLYLAVAGAFILRVIFGVVAAMRLWFGAQPVFFEDEPGSFPRLHLRSSRAIASPVTIGSAVLLPADFSEWDAEKLSIVLAHERSHIRQGDFYLQLLAALYAALFWFSPLGWWLKSKLRNLGEAIGDHAALNQAASPASYAQLLLEFAALPRPTLIGVDMARPSTISQRIDRLLNDSTFSQAFAGGKRRALLAVLVVPVAIFAAVALVRVEAAGVGQAQAPSPATSPSPAGAASAPNPAKPAAPADVLQSPDAAPQAPDAAPAPVSGSSSSADAALPPRPPQVPAVPGNADQPDVPNPPDLLIETDGPNSPGSPKLIILRDQAKIMAQANAQVKAQVDAQVKAQVDVQVKAQVNAQVNAQMQAMAAGTYKMLQDAGVYQLKGPDGEHSYSYVLSDNGDSYAIVSGPDAKINFSGRWNGAKSEDIEKASKMAHGKFLWFSHDGKSYIVEDPAVIAQIEEMYKPMEVLGREQGELGKKQAELGKLEGDLGKQAQLVKITAPDISKEMAEITAAMTKLQAQMGQEINRTELAEVQGKLGQLQGKLGALQGGFAAKEDWGKMGELGKEQGKLGAEQGRLGAEEGRLAREADRKVKGLIDESLQNGKAKPVE